MGVPLEEMDAVFGEGNVHYHSAVPIYSTVLAEELEERLEDEESERASLVSRRSSRSRRSRLSVTRAGVNPEGRGVLSRLLSQRSRANYEPIQGDE